MLNHKNFYLNPFEECCTLLWDATGECVLADPGALAHEEMAVIRNFISEKGLRPTAIWLTHGHFDHIYGVAKFAAEYGIKVYMDPADKIMLENNHILCAKFHMPVPDNSFVTTDIKEGDVLNVGKYSFTVISTPGHTPGGVCFHCEEKGLLISGDTLFAGSIGRTDSPWGDYDSLIKGIMEKLMDLDGDTRVIPGHGPQTTIGFERTHNPFLEPFNEPWETSAPGDTQGIEIHGTDQ